MQSYLYTSKASKITSWTTRHVSPLVLVSKARQVDLIHTQFFRALLHALLSNNKKAKKGFIHSILLLSLLCTCGKKEEEGMAKGGQTMDSR